MSITGYPAGLPKEHNGLSSKVTVQLMFMLILVFLKEQCLARQYFYYTSMTLLVIFLLASDYLRVIQTEQDHHQDFNHII